MTRSVVPLDIGFSDTVGIEDHPSAPTKGHHTPSPTHLHHPFTKTHNPKPPRPSPPSCSSSVPPYGRLVRARSPRRSWNHLRTPPSPFRCAASHHVLRGVDEEPALLSSSWGWQQHQERQHPHALSGRLSCCSFLLYFNLFVFSLMGIIQVRVKRLRLFYHMIRFLVLLLLFFLALHFLFFFCSVFCFFFVMINMFFV